ncbi:ABC transporter ATPase [Pedobacter sp. HMF7647]|uniref:ABC transporter ATPase n=1 Tax=Hufsiella arboris TaxID=2695275 RepID=A0A7K1YEI0_9SPHI|nr:ABC transporter ATPase [Hufsiella arboris]MXV53013.1 ABC transporter ATPase [Hufsiella arboris]
MQFSQHSRIWIYQSQRALTSQEVHEISTILQNFVGQWQAHGNDLEAGFEIRYDRFIILIIDESVAGATGCSIDKSVKVLHAIDQQYNLNLFDRFNLAYRDHDLIIDCTRSEFEAKIIEALINENTIVFNNMVQTLAELNTSWEIPYAKSWHARVFGELAKA